MVRKIVALISGVAVCLTLTSCALTNKVTEAFEREMRGTGGTYRTYSKTGNTMDNISGESIKITRDERFDVIDGEGHVERGDMIQVQVGDHFVNHVGSTAVLFSRGLEVVTPADTGFDITSNTKGVPWLGKLMELHRDVWKGSAKTVLVRTQDDVPVALFAGAEVEFVPTTVPKATVLRVTGADGRARYALVYRANLSIYDTALLTK